MTRKLQILRGTTAQNDAYTGSIGELTMDTDRNEVRIHDGQTVGGIKISDRNMPILTSMFFDHITNDMSWLRADTFSWQSGDVYVAAYEHLADDAAGVEVLYAFRGSGNPTIGDDIAVDTVYAKTETVSVGSTVYLDTNMSVSSTITGVSGNTITSIASVSGYDFAFTDGYVRNSAYDYMSGSKTDTIGNITITYYLADDGHKICLPDQESNIAALYNATGVAWYFILDTENKQFKLPRTKHGFTGLRDSVGGYVKPGAPNITGSVGEYWTQAASGAFYSDSNNKGSETNSSHGTNNLSFDASRSSSIYGASDTIQPPATQMYLYFYVGFYAQEAVEQTAGINAEMFNDLNAHKVIEFQAPTADNGYTWYRKYADGWVEQGGQLTGRSITFPIPFAQEPTLAFADKSSVNTAVYHNTYSSLTTTGFDGWRMGTNSNWLGSESDWAGKWVAYGMAA